MIGIDYFEGDAPKQPNFETLKSIPGLSFVIVRATYGTYVDGTPNKKTNKAVGGFLRDWAAIKAAKLVRGAYAFQRFDHEAPSDEAQAEAYCNAVELEPDRDFPPLLDVEFPVSRAKLGLTVAQTLDRVRKFVAVLKDHYGVTPGIYTSARVWAEDLGNTNAADLGDCPGWFAKPWPWDIRQKGQLNGAPAYYPKIPPPWGDATNWWLYQYQGDARDVPGIWQCDLNRFHSIGRGTAAGSNQVRWIQRKFPELVADGNFGPKTEAAIKDFQLDKGLVSNGIVEPRTFAALCWRTAEETPYRKAFYVKNKIN